MKKCFVISPIGEPGSDTRQRSDDVLEYIIEPALIGLEVEAIRGDQFPKPGLITDQVIDAIINYDFCIADLSGHNPNVFYELAIAQAACRQVVLLKLIGEQIPFDVKDYRLIEYDLKPRSMKTDKWIPLLRNQVATILSPEFTPRPLFGGSVSQKTDSIRSYIINAHSKDFGDPPKYHEVVSSASNFCYLMGVSLKVWASTDGQRVLQGLARRGLKVRILIMSPSNPGLGAMINAQLPTESLQAVKEQTRRMEMYFRNFIKDNSYGTFQVRTINEGIPHFQLMITDQTALVVQYMFCRGTEDSPLQQFPVGTDLYGAFRQEFEDLWTMNDLTQVSYTNANLADSSAEQVKPDNPAAAFEPAKSQPQD